MKKILTLLLISLSTIAYSNDCGECIVEKARKEIGVTENGRNNSGTRIAQYLAHTKIFVPAAWCSSFVSFILSECGIKHSVNAWSPTATATNRIYDRRFPKKNTTEIKAGDVATLFYKNLGRIGHALIIENPNPNKNYYTTIEGNTNEQGSRETTTGRDGVFRRKRLKSSIYQISRHCN